MNLAFDVTPAKYVTGLITEKGVCEATNLSPLRSGNISLRGRRMIKKDT